MKQLYKNFMFDLIIAISALVLGIVMLSMKSQLLNAAVGITVCTVMVTFLIVVGML